MQLGDRYQRSPNYDLHPAQPKSHAQPTSHPQATSHPQTYVISTGAANTFIVRSAVERPLYFALSRLPSKIQSQAPLGRKLTVLHNRFFPTFPLFRDPHWLTASALLYDVANESGIIGRLLPECPLTERNPHAEEASRTSLFRRSPLRPGPPTRNAPRRR